MTKEGDSIKIAKLEANVDNIKIDISEIKGDNKDIKNDLRTLVESTRTFQQSYDNLRKDISIIYGKLTDHESRESLNTTFRVRLQNNFKLITGIISILGVTNVIAILAYVLDMMNK